MIFAIRDYHYNRDKKATIDDQHTYYINSKYIECITVPDEGCYAKLCLHGNGDQYFSIEKKRAIDIVQIMEQENKE